MTETNLGSVSFQSWNGTYATERNYERKCFDSAAGQAITNLVSMNSLILGQLR